LIPVAMLVGGIAASGGLLQRHLDLPDAATVVLQGIIFVTILASDAVYGRIPWFKSAEAGV
jgi:simple sugar transport system permease protein